MQRFDILSYLSVVILIILAYPICGLIFHKHLCLEPISDYVGLCSSLLLFFPSKTKKYSTRLFEITNSTFIRKMKFS